MKYEACHHEQCCWQYPFALGAELVSMSETNGATLSWHNIWGLNGISIPFQSHKFCDGFPGAGVFLNNGLCLYRPGVGRKVLLADFYMGCCYVRARIFLTQLPFFLASLEQE